MREERDKGKDRGVLVSVCSHACSLFVNASEDLTE